MKALDAHRSACRDESTSARRQSTSRSAGGASIFSGCTFEGCSASEAQGGGALFVEGGSVVLRQATHLRGNHAGGELESIRLLRAMQDCKSPLIPHRRTLY